MAHPHRSQAHESSRAKFKAITGTHGGGHAHAGSSHMLKAGEHGVLKKWSGHHKTHKADEHAHGGRSKARADKYARGGHVKGKDKSPKNVTINITQPSHGADAGRPPIPPPMPPAGPPSGGAPPMPPGGGVPPMGGAPGGMPGGAPGANPLAQLGKGMGFKRGGKVPHANKAQPGDSRYDLSHWRDYAAKDRPKRASGGGIKMTAGAMSGVGRLEQAEHEKRKHGR